MRIVIAGGSGFLGRALAESLLAAGHDVVVLTRQPTPAAPGAALAHPAIRLVQWLPDGSSGPWAAALEGADAVVSLAGESIASGRWSPARKDRLRNSRLDATTSLVTAFGTCEAPPSAFVSGSAVGYYGVRGGEPLSEKAGSGDDFLARLCVDWERAASEAAEVVNRVAIIRTGLVLDRDEGALARMLTPFRLFAGGPIASGRQFMSWIHLDDWVGLVNWAIADRRVTGAVNATAPNPVPNAEFARALGSVLGRPALVPTPAFALRALFGEMADLLLVGGQRVLPKHALELGFRFRYEELKPALEDLLKAPN